MTRGSSRGNRRTVQSATSAAVVWFMASSNTAVGHGDAGDHLILAKVRHLEGLCDR
ncbi:hypothetical protein ACFFX0_14075 [Citricoccus parietis]|uniref:Uncharacterized protein n=1 Tax=Citricoccus parietis TaxID=592307 RepID=A0ABV5G015_9MICC